MSRLALKNGHVIDPAQKIDAKQDIYIAEGKIVSIGAKPADFTADQTIDCSNKIISPGLIDCGIRLGTGDQKCGASLESETQAAAANGITTVVCQPDGSSIIDSTTIVATLAARARNNNQAKLLLLAAMTEGLAGEQMAPIASLQKAGCVGITQANHPLNDIRLLRHCFEYAATFKMPVLIQPLDIALAAGGIAHEGEVSMRLGLPGIPAMAETIALSQALLLQEQTGVHLHFHCVSTAESIQLLASAKQRGMSITADVAIANLFLTEWDVDNFNAMCHTLPPLRSVADQEALLSGIEKGIITSLCSNHLPLGKAAKLAPFPSTTPGISGVDTLLPLLIALQHKTKLSLSALLNLVTYAPAQLLKLDAGTLCTNAAADICIFDAQTSFTLTEAMLHSRGKNTPLIGWLMQGKVMYTLVDGKIVYKNNNNFT